MSSTLAILFPGSQECSYDFAIIQHFVQKQGIDLIQFAPSPPVKNLDLCQTIPVSQRLNYLLEALFYTDVSMVWSGRGGYGVSDLLPMIPWAKLKKIPPKKIIGFSDISALHSAFYAKLGWPGIHGPMAFTPYWDKSSLKSKKDFLKYLTGFYDQISLPLQYIQGGQRKIFPKKKMKGNLFGGCFSVLTNLIGTPYFPKSLAGNILFFEDIGESPPRILRYLNQWCQAGVFKGVSAVILGRFVGLTQDHEQNAKMEKSLISEIALRLFPLPVFRSKQFGHMASQKFIPIGQEGVIDFEKTFQLTFKG